MPTNGLSTKPLKVKLLAGEQKATEGWLGGQLAGLFHQQATTNPTLTLFLRVFPQPTLSSRKLSLNISMPNLSAIALENVHSGRVFFEGTKGASWLERARRKTTTASWYLVTMTDPGAFRSR